MNLAPIVSVIVPIYKVENYLKPCIDSILDQTMKEIEIILVDDGSPDKCGEICNEYALIDHRIKVIHQENQGLSAARNSGISIAKGEYLVFVDSDDIIHDTMVESLLNCLISNNAEMSTCKTIVFYDNNFIRQTNSNSSLVTSKFDKKKAFKSILQRDGLVSYSAWGKMYKKELFNIIRYPVGKIYEDALILPELLSIVNFIGRVENTYYYYRIRKGSIMRDLFSETDLERISIVDSFSEEAINYFPELVSYVPNFKRNIRIEISNKLLYSDNYKKYLQKFKMISKEIYDINKSIGEKRIYKTFYIIGHFPLMYCYYMRVRKMLKKIKDNLATIY